MNPEHFLKIKQESNPDPETPVVHTEIIEVSSASDDDAILYAFMSRPLSSGFSTSESDDDTISYASSSSPLSSGFCTPESDDDTIPYASPSRPLASEPSTLESDGDTIPYASPSRPLSSEPSTSSAINNEIHINRTRDVINFNNDFIDIETIIAHNKLIIEKYKEGSKVNEQHNVDNDVITKDESPTSSNIKRENRNEIMQIPCSVQEEVILIDDEDDNIISNASNC